MSADSKATLKTLLDAQLPSGSPNEYITVADLRQLLINVFDSYANTTDDPEALHASSAAYNTKDIIITTKFTAATDVATGDGAAFFHVPASMNGMNIVSVHALNSVAGITGQCDVQINNVTLVADVLSTVMSIDTTEVGSDTGATPAVINVANDALATNDILRIDVDAIHSGTAPKGLTVVIEARLP